MKHGVHCFTSFSFSYLSRARVLAKTLKLHNPDWTLWALVTDREPEGFTFDLERENFDEVVYFEELDIPELEAWSFRHGIVEICTAVKGAFMAKLLEEGAEKVVYLDPDIAVFHPLDEIESLLDSYEILLTPHQLAPDAEKFAIIDNEICSLKHGTFNLGFMALRNREQGRECAEWWRDRLLEFCYDDISNGLFTDQRWCDLVPIFFPKHQIVRDPGCNVASWNLSQRHIEITEKGEILVNGSELKFYHFTKLGPVGDRMTARYARGNMAVYELWAWYRDMVERFEEEDIPSDWWHFGNFENGQKISLSARRMYRERVDLRKAFPNPYATGTGTFYQWLTDERLQ